MFFHGTTLGDKCRNAASAKLTAPGSCVPSALTCSRRVSHPRNRNIVNASRDCIVVTPLEEKYVRDVCKGANAGRRGMGNKDDAFAWLDRAYQERPSWLVRANVEPRFDPLRSDPRFTLILTRMRLLNQTERIPEKSDLSTSQSQ